MSDRTVSVLRSHDDRPVPAAGVYEIDGAHTAVEFVARHLMITKVRGRFTAVRGTITIAEEPERSHVEVVIDAGSIDTGNPDRDAHLRSPDFFDVMQHPTLTFGSSVVQARRDGAWEVLGNLSIRGVSRAVGLRVEFDGAQTSPAGDERIGFSATAEVDREDFGLRWNQALEAGGVLIGRIVRIELAVQAVHAGGGA